MVKTLNGKEIKIIKKGASVWVNNAMVETTDMISSNGVTHIINTVLMP